MKNYLCRFLDGAAQSAGDGPIAAAAQSEVIYWRWVS